MQMSSIIGNIIAGIMLKTEADQSTLFIVFTVLAIVSSLLFLCLKPNQDKKEDETK